MPRFGIILTILIVAVLAFVGWQWRNSPFFERLWGTTNEGQLIAEVSYICDAGKTISASLYKGKDKPGTPNEPPVPGGYATVVLSDGRTFELTQTVSADGGRYATRDESFVFWDKGNKALILENRGQEECIKTAGDPGNLPLIFADSDWGFSIRYATGTPTMDPGGVYFRVDPRIASGTNLSSDTSLVVAQLNPADPGAVRACEAKSFLTEGRGTSTRYSEGSVVYSYATSSGAAAGNRYEEVVYALSDTNPCTAIRYFIHYGAIENYPPGVVKEFDRNALLAQFDAMRKTLIVAQ